MDDVNNPDFTFQLIQMQLIKELVIIDHKADTPIYLQITNAFIQHIRRGHLRKGLKLPGSREAADLLGINRMTMVAAYQELDAQGWIEMLPRKGTFIRSDIPLVTPAKITGADSAVSLPLRTSFLYDEKRIVPVPVADFPSTGKLIFNDGFPDPRLAPVEELIRSMRSQSRLPLNRKYLMYGGAKGTDALRERLAAFLSDTRGLPVTQNNILITRGAQMGIYISSAIIIGPGQDIIVGAPGYFSANLTFQQAGANINYVPVDEEGMDIDAVEKLCKKKKICMVYVIPHHHNPTTVTLTPERRLRLLQLAARYKFAIIEDDYDYDFHYASKPMMPMASLDSNGSIVYIGTLTKTLAPAIRIGFIVAPENFIRSATYFRKNIDSQGDSLMENAIAELYNDGTISRHIKRSVKIYRERRDHLCQLLHNELGHHVSFQIPDGGMSVWTKFLTASLPEITAKAAKKGLIMNDGMKYNSPAMQYNATRLGFASLNVKEQEQAVKILKEILQ